jgi:transcriptional regulator with AAA-type ATPase domain/NAD-dependent dihydropyrimidine dehydrogenase PreA subunit
MLTQEIAIWLKERSALNILDQATLLELAPELESRSFASQQNVVTEGTNPDGLYILLSGRLEDQKANVSLLSGAVINLQELLLDQAISSNILTLNEAELWYIDREKFVAFADTHPELGLKFTKKLANDLEELASQLSFEQERQTILRPYLVNRAKRGIVGKSSYATRLRSQIQAASHNREPVLIFGEPGLEKDNMAALIHFGSDDRHEPIVKVDCASLQSNGFELLGKFGAKMGLLEALKKGTLILNNIQELPGELIPVIIELLQKGSYCPVGGQKKQSQARIIMISENAIPNVDRIVKDIIKVPPLRVRKADINYQVDYYLNIICTRKGINKIEVAPEALRRLQAYDFPNNLRELANLVERAVTQLSGSNVITEEIIWPSQGKKKQLRFNLLNAYPALRNFLNSSWYPERINYGFTTVAFALIVAILFLGPQNRAENFALNLFWAWWWPLSLLAFPFLGRIWCAFCPFMIYGEIVQKLSLYFFPRELKKWPRASAEKWGGWFIFALFALILLWEELWDLPNTAYLSACLLLLITAGAIIFSVIFERRLWCRYLCPIGGMNGMFAKLSMTELRAQQGTCSAECTTYQCYKGGPAKGEGLATDGCPLYSHPAQLNDNRDCVLCMTCLKACPHRSVELNLRPPAIELWTSHLPRLYEVALLFLLLDVVFLHHLGDILPDLDLSKFPIHAGISILILALPAILPILASRLAQSEQISWIKLAYGYLPIVLAANLAHYLNLGLSEAGRIIPVSFATFGLSKANLPILVADPAVISFLQGVTLLVGLLCSVVVAINIAKGAWRKLLPQHIASLLLTISLWQVIL